MNLSKVLNKAAQTGVFDNAEKKALLKLAAALLDARVATFADTAGGISTALVEAGLMEPFEGG